MSVFNKKIAQKLWKDYYHATKWAHHHTMMVLGGLIIAGTMLSWQATNFLDGATHADWTPTWCQDNSGSLQIPEGECDVLLDLYLATDGDNWTNSQQNNGKWFQGDGSNICWNWYGVAGCDRSALDNKWHVQIINMENNNLSGVLSNSLYTLPGLLSLYLKNNPYLNVNIDDITSSPYASNYQNINVSDDTIHGNITNFGNLPNLEYLDVACYYTANFDNCDATGDISFVPSLPKLYALNVGGHVGVTFDLSYLSSSPQIRQIFALNNYIVGDIDVLAGNTGMTQLDLGCWDLLDGQCDVSGHMSTLADMTNLQSVDFDALLNIQGTLDSLSGKTQLQWADFSHNQGLYGTLDGIKNIPDIRDFDVDDTSIGGTLPVEMYNWVNLSDLNIGGNELSGSLLEFSQFRKLNGLHLGHNNLDYTNVWDTLLGDDIAPPPACVPTPEKPCTGKPFRSPLQNLEINQANIGGNLPDMWSHFTNLTNLDIQFAHLTGPIPASFASLINLQDLRMHFNNFDGPIPTFLTSLKLDQGKTSLESNCFDTDVTDPDLLALLHDHAQGWNNQLNCRANVQVETSLGGSGLVAGSCSPYTISYENLGPQKAINVDLGQVFDSNLTVSGSVPAYTTGLVGRVYGTNDDPCYVSGVQYGTGPYYTWLNNLMVTNYEIPSLYSLAVYQGGFTGAQGTTELGFVLDRFCPMIFSTSDRATCFLLFGSSFADVDPSCGAGGEPGYLRNLGTVQAGSTGSITVDLCVPADLSGSVSFGSKVSTVSTNENGNSSNQNFQFIIQAPNGNGSGGDSGTGTGDGGGGDTGGDNNSGDNGGSTPPPTTDSHRSTSASISKDKCLPNPPGDQSASYYDGECDGTGHNSANDSGDALFDPKSYLPELTDVRNYVRDLPQGISVDVEQIKAFLFAKRSKLTNMMDYASFDPDGVLTRGTWAKFLVAFAENVLGKKANADRLPICSHTYTDVGSDLGDLKDYIIKACLFQYMGVENDRTTPLTMFNPNEILTRKDLATVISRVIRGSKNDGVSPYWAKHSQALYEAGLIRNTNPEIVDSRINAITILMRATEQYDTLFGAK